MNHTLARNRRLFGLLRDTGTQNFREELSFSFSHGRTGHSSELSDLEADELIRHLEKMMAPKAKKGKVTRSGIEYDGQKMRRRILSLCYSVGWVKWNDRSGRHTIDWDRLNGWMHKYGYLHKPMNDYRYTELQQLVKQFEYMASAILTEKTTA